MATKFTTVHTPTAADGRRPWRSGRFSQKARALIAVATFGSVLGLGVLAAAGPAGAATGTVTYGYGGLTTVLQDYPAAGDCTFDGHLPTSMINYTGTSMVLTTVTLNVEVNGSWSQYMTWSATAKTWVYSGNQLASIYWDNNLPGSQYWSFGVAKSPSAHYNWEVDAASAWDVNGHWYISSVANLGDDYC